MSGPFEGVKVIEVAAWTFVPAAGAILADLGANVIKVEPPTGDPQRMLMNMLNQSERGPNPFLEIPNRGKRSITLDLSTPEGRDVLLSLVETADVFLTSYLPALRTKMKIDVEDLRAVNPKLIYALGNGWGSQGPMVNTGGYDFAAAWASSGTMHKLTKTGADFPAMQPAAYYDLQGANAIAGSTAMALFKRERTGEPSVVDVSLINVGMWAMGADIAGAPFMGGEIPRMERDSAANPITNPYRTQDGRWIVFVCLQADRFWGEFCSLIERVDLIVDERYADAPARFQNRVECILELDAVFATKTLDEWKVIFADFSGVWSPILTPAEVHDHVQVKENGFLAELNAANGTPFWLVAPPYQFDGKPTVPQGRAPELGADTDAILAEVGLDAEKTRSSGALG